MKTQTTPRHEESTYAMLMRANQEERSFLESAVYLLLIVCMSFFLGQAALQPFHLPRFGLLQESPIARATPPSAPSA